MDYSGMVRTWLLLADSADGIAVPLTLRLQRGVISNTLKVRLSSDVSTESDLHISATQSAEQAYQLLWSEAYERRSQRVTYKLPDLSGQLKGNINIEGRSADLAFALGLLGEALGGETFPPLAATGRIGDLGEVLSVAKIPEKVKAALEALPEHGVVVFPAESKAEISSSLHKVAAGKNIRLLPVNRLDEAAEKLGMRVQKIYFDSPFRGLEAFGFEHACMYFGRDTEVAEVRTKLKELGAVLILGASGSGKSSLAQAGVLAELAKRSQERDQTDYQWAIYTPRNRGGDASWDTSLHRAWKATQMPEELLLDVTPKSLKFAASEVSSQPHNQLIFIVDQLEELFTQGYPDNVFQDFVNYLDSLHKAGIWVLATLRNDFYPAYQASPLAGLFDEKNHYNLKQPDNLALQQMIEMPAHFAGVTYESSSEGKLSDLIREDASNEVGVLPLLEYTLSELFISRNQKKRELTFDAYESFGGVKGSIGRVAERIYMGLETAEQETTPYLLRQLVRWDEESQRFVARPFELQVNGSAILDHIIECLSAPDIRLLVKDNEDGSSIVRLAHEALLSHWERAARWLESDHDFLKWLARVEQEAKQWKGDGEIRERLLPKGKPLSDAESYLKTRSEDISPEITHYIRASIKSARKKQRVSWVAAASVFFSLILLTAWAVTQEKKGGVIKEKMLVTQNLFLADLSSQAAEKGFHDKAMLLALNALPGLYGSISGFEGHSRPLTDEAILALKNAQRKNTKIAELRHTNKITFTSFSPDGKLILTTSVDKTAVLWSASTGKQLHIFPHEKGVSHASFDQSGTRILTATKDGLISLWDIGTRDKLKTFDNKSTGDTSIVKRVFFLPDEQRFIAVSANQVVVWSIEEEKPIDLLNTDHHFLLSALSSDGNYFAAGSAYNFTVWDLGSGKQLPSIKAGTVRINHLAFSIDNKDLIVAMSSMGRGQVRVFSAETGELILNPFLSQGYIGHVAPHPTDKDILLVSSTHDSDSTASKISFDTHIDEWKALEYFPHKDPINKIAYNDDGSELLTASDKKVLRWKSNQQLYEAPVQSFSHIGNIQHINFSSDEKRVLTATERSAILWRVEDQVVESIDGYRKLKFVESVTPKNDITTERLILSQNLVQDAIKTLPKNRTCLTPEERKESHLPELDNEQWLDRGCPQFIEKK